ncbi:MAG: hypothetical protein AUK54_04240 [Helicobacteraceae bacterium CG2_30_36_10]|nr:MAG: hypothetical protein AUK54_04240 [Helicobacteraceae bacterium CG2_30_36_10]
MCTGGQVHAHYHTYEVNEKTFDFCYEKAYEMTGGYLSGKNTGWVVFFGIMLLLTIIIGIIVISKNDANIQIFKT